MTTVRSPRLRRELNLRLTFPVLVIVALAGLLGTYGAKLHVDRVFDRWLLDAAKSLAHQVRLQDGQAVIALSPQAEAMLTFDVVDRTYFEVAQGGRHLIGQTGIPRHGEHEASYRGAGRAFDARIAGQDIRVAAVSIDDAGVGETTVLVAETMIKRERARGDLLLTLAPAAALVLVAAFVIDRALRRTLGTLQRMASRWNDRAHESLAAIPADDLPNELLPFATALNDLLQRVRSMLERERQFAATVAHQLRTPLAGLRLGLARAAAAPDAAAARVVLDELGTTTQRTARLVQQLLALSRLDPDVRDRSKFTEIDLVALARETGETYLDAAQARQIVLEMVAGAPVTMVRGEPELLREALGNLLDNAIRYTLAGGRVLMSVQASPPAVCVSDSGPGIPADEQPRIFERFVRGRGAAGDGSGLGLAIVKEITALHAAVLSVADGERGGASLTIQFPERPG